MMMKQRDLQAATALMIQGYLRANGEDNRNANVLLFDAISAIRQEAGDWAENLKLAPSIDPSAVEPKDLEVAFTAGGIDLARTPYNLVSAAISLIGEAVDLNGSEAIAVDFDRRQILLQVVVQVPFNVDDAIAEANRLAKEIDAATVKPAEKMARWDILCTQLREHDVDVEERVTAPENW